MPTEVIDMGFYSETQWMLWDRSGNRWATNTSAGWPTTEQAVKDISRPWQTWIRDRVATAMEAENGGQNWRVSRIFEWEGDAGYWAYGFVVQHLNAGVPDGPEWLWSFHGLLENNSGPIESEHEQVWGLHSIQGPFGRVGTGNDTFWCCHYNPDGTASSYDIDANPADTYNKANDFNPPNSNPRTQIDAFMPDRNLSQWGSGWARWTEAADLDRQACKWIIQYNHEVPFMGMMATTEHSWWPRFMAWLGDIIVPRVASDTLTNGAFWLFCRPGLSQVVIDQGPYIYALNPDTGLNENFNWYLHTEYTYENQPRADGTYDKDVVKIANSNLDKGHLDPELFCIIGPHRQDLGRLYDSTHGVLWKAFDTIAVPWSATAPIFPGGYPTNGWFGPRVQSSVP